MPLIVDEKWLKDYTARTGKGVQGGRTTTQTPAAPAPLAQGSQPAPKRPKYGNIRTETEDGTFDSRHEAKVWEELKLRARAGEIRAVGRQAVFFLPGGVRYIADFVIWTDDGEIQVLDAKSEATKKDKTYRIKKRLMLDTFGIDIKEV